MNPGSIAVAEKDENGRFKRAIVIVHVFATAVGARQTILGIDCAHSKCPVYSGVQMMLVGRDGDLKNTTIAFALVPTEDGEKYVWFFDKIIRGGYKLAGIPMLCDRGSGLLSVAGDFDLNLKFCTLHIIRNISHQFGRLSQSQKNQVWRLQAAETREEYDSILAIIGLDMGPSVMSCVASIDPIRWCVHANIGVVSLFGWRTSNFVESVFGSQLIMGLRSMHPFEFLQAMCTRMMEDCYTRAMNSERWEGQQLEVTSGSKKIYDKQTAQVGAFAVQNASTDVSYVYNASVFPRVRRRVTLSMRHCTCGFTDQHGIPCRHIAAALKDHGELNTVFALFNECYLVKNYVAAFANRRILIPIETEIGFDPSRLPALFVRRLGRSKQRRIRSNGEDTSGGSSNPYHCSRCDIQGHNRRSCIASVRVFTRCRCAAQHCLD